MATIQRVLRRINSQHPNLLRPITNAKASCSSPNPNNASSVIQTRTIIGHNNNATHGVGGRDYVVWGRTIAIYSTKRSRLSSFSTNTATVTSPTKTEEETTAATTIEIRELPTRHSRKEVPQVAPFGSLEEMTGRMLDSVPGNIYEYAAEDMKLTRMEEYQNGLAKSYHTQQTIEYILRGYSATFPRSIVQTTQPDTITDDSWSQPSKERAESYVQNLEKMIQLLERIEEEGAVYVELRSKFRSQLARRDTDQDTDTAATPNDATNPDTQTDEESKLQKLYVSYGAPPGPSTAMYDLILDAISVSIPHLSPPTAIHWIAKSQSISNRSLQRHTLDISAGMNAVNPDSIPTALTFNAVIRAAADAPYDGIHDELRDTALSAALFVYDAMHHYPAVERNSATYKYMLRTVGRYLPVSPSKGNIAHALFFKACVEERVLDEGIVRALMEDVLTYEGNGTEPDSLGMDFDDWIENNIKVKYDEGKNGYGFPMKWSSKKKARRYDKRFAEY